VELLGAWTAATTRPRGGSRASAGEGTDRRGGEGTGEAGGARRSEAAERVEDRSRPTRSEFQR
jgi:hypothetical protein